MLIRFYEGKMNVRMFMYIIDFLDYFVLSNMKNVVMDSVTDQICLYWVLEIKIPFCTIYNDIV